MGPPRSGRPVGVKLPVTGSYRSAEARGRPPPATSTLPAPEQRGSGTAPLSAERAGPGPFALGRPGNERVGKGKQHDNIDDRAAFGHDESPLWDTGGA